MQEETNLGITRDEALQLMEKYLKTENLQKHSLATEAIIITLLSYIKTI